MCDSRRYSPEENKIRHTLDGKCWISYATDDGETLSLRTTEDIEKKLKTGEYIVLHKVVGKEQFPYLMHVGPGARDNLISGEYTIVKSPPTRPFNDWIDGRIFLLDSMNQEGLELEMLKWALDADGNPFLIIDSSDKLYDGPIKGYKLPSPYKENIMPHVIDVSELFPKYVEKILTTYNGVDIKDGTKIINTERNLIYKLIHRYVLHQGYDWILSETSLTWDNIDLGPTDKLAKERLDGMLKSSHYKLLDPVKGGRRKSRKSRNKKRKTKCRR